MKYITQHLRAQILAGHVTRFDQLFATSENDIYKLEIETTASAIGVSPERLRKWIKKPRKMDATTMILFSAVMNMHEDAVADLCYNQTKEDKKAFWKRLHDEHKERENMANT